MTWLALLAKYWKPLALIALLAGSHVYAFQRGENGAQRACEAVAHKALAQSAVAEADAQRRAREAEQSKARVIAEIDRGHQEDLANVQKSADRVIADLRAGNVKLRQHWQGCQATSRVSGAATAAGQPDGQDGLRHESMRRILGWVGQLQAQRDALIDVAEADREHE